MSVHRAESFAWLLVPLLGCSGEPVVFSPGPSDQRLVVAPSSIAVLSDSSDSGGLPGAVILGGAHDPDVLLLGFDRVWARAGGVRAAFLHLTPRAGAPPVASRTVVHASRIRASWQGADLDPSSRPSLGPPYAEASSDANGSVTIDVTALIRSADKRPDDDYGIALSAERGAEPGAVFATGASGGTGPRLELFVR